MSGPHHTDNPARAEPDADPRPWERPGALRRDCAPHRGLWLRFLADSALLLSIIGVGVPLGLTILVLARRDLAAMHAGVMDPAGRQQMTQAVDRATRSLALGVVCLFLWGVLLALHALL